jgi:hypothetical protein
MRRRARRGGLEQPAGVRSLIDNDGITYIQADANGGRHQR